MRHGDGHTGRMIGVIVLAAGLTGTASAQNAGDIVFHDNDNDVYYLPQGGGPAIPQLITSFNGPNDRLLGFEVGPFNEIYVGNMPNPIENPNNATTFKITNWFGGPANVDPLAVGGNIQNTTDYLYDNRTTSLLAINNPGSQDPFPNKFEGILGIGANTGATSVVFDQASLGQPPLPRYNNGLDIAKDRINADNFFVTTQGSEFFYPTDNQPLRSSTLHRFVIDNNLQTVTEELIVDLGNTAVTGLSEALGQPNSVETVPGLNAVFVTANDFVNDIGFIYRVDLDNQGDFAGITEVLSGQFFPGDLTYNKFTGKFLFGDRRVSTGGNIYEVNIDGTGLNSILNGFIPGGIDVVVPAPGSLALLGLGGLVAARRRR